jgi:hypothetical protein
MRVWGHVTRRQDVFCDLEAGQGFQHTDGELRWVRGQVHRMLSYVWGEAIRPLMARNGHCGAATARPLSEVKRKTFAQREYFAF